MVQVGKEIISGVNPIYEVLRANTRKVDRIWIAQKHGSDLLPEILELAEKKRIPIVNSSRDEIYNLSKVEKNQGIIARVDIFKYSTVEDILEIGKKDPKGHFILILDNILDPQNLGSIIRTAHLMGVHGVIIPERNSASIGPASTRASAGAVEYIPIASVTNISRTIEKLKKEGIWVVGAEVGGQDLYSSKFSGSYALVVGSEGKGMRRLVKESCDILVTIPMQPLKSGVGSYNVSVASAIFMSEVARQRNLKNR